MSDILTRLFTTPAGQGALIFGLALFLYSGIPQYVQKEQVFVRSREYDRRNGTELAIHADPRNKVNKGPVSFSQVAHRQPKRK